MSVGSLHLQGREGEGEGEGEGVWAGVEGEKDQAMACKWQHKEQLLQQCITGKLATRGEGLDSQTCVCPRARAAKFM